jgi:catechol 2,3-dioxygenase-like lactoylglutathione lyase family enzyme
MITNVSLVSVWVTDLDEAVAFYTDVLASKLETTFDSVRISGGSLWAT